MFASTALQYLGIAAALKLNYDLFSFLWLYLRPSSLSRYRRPTGESWALVSGASDGIGYGFAEVLCSKGFNVLLHGRNPSKLADVRKSLESKFPGVQTEIVIADAFDPQADINSIVTTAENLPGQLTILINNVGGAPLAPVYGGLNEVDADYVDKIMNLNARFPIQLTRALLPLLTKNTPALIMNITSATGLRGMPFITTYCSSKAFNYTFSEALGTELRAQKIDIEVLGIIVGNVISGRNRTDFKGFTCSSLTLASGALQRIGCGRANVWGWYRHALQWKMISFVPEWLMDGQLIEVMRDRKTQDEKGQ